MDENAVGEAWADGGALFSASASGDRMSFTLRSLTRTEVLDASMRLAARHLADPAFSADIWARERERWSASLRESLTKPGTVADRAWTPAVFGTHPYGQQTTPESLLAVSVSDMQAFHARHIVPCRAKVSVVGVSRNHETLMPEQYFSLSAWQEINSYFAKRHLENLELEAITNFQKVKD